jgi:hypothetical protein
MWYVWPFYKEVNQLISSQLNSASSLCQSLEYSAYVSDFPGHLIAMLRSLVIHRLGYADDKSVVSEAKARFAAHCDGSALLPADLRSAVSP